MTLDEFLQFVHPTIIHFPIVGFVIGSIAALFAFLLLIIHKLMKNKSFYQNYHELMELFIDRLELFSWINILIGELFFPFVVVTGIIDANGIENAINQDLLAYKIKLSVYIYFIMLSPIFLKLFASSIFNDKVFGESIIISILYLVPLLIANILTLIVAGAGGKYTFGRSLFDRIGLNFLIPKTIEKPQTNEPITFIDQTSITNNFLILTFIIFLFLLFSPIIVLKGKKIKNIREVSNPLDLQSKSIKKK